LTCGQKHRTITALKRQDLTERTVLPFDCADFQLATAAVCGAGMDDMEMSLSSEHTGLPLQSEIIEEYVF
jgi:hypothetical protein